MQRNDKIVFITTVSVVAYATNAFLKIRSENKIRRQQIRAKSKKDVEAIQKAAALIEARIEAGTYTGTGTEDLKNELEFESIVQFNDM